jgi:hypothetical protein
MLRGVKISFDRVYGVNFSPQTFQTSPVAWYDMSDSLRKWNAESDDARVCLQLSQAKKLLISHVTMGSISQGEHETDGYRHNCSPLKTLDLNRRRQVPELRNSCGRYLYFLAWTISVLPLNAFSLIKHSYDFQRAIILTWVPNLSDNGQNPHPDLFYFIHSLCGTSGFRYMAIIVFSHPSSRMETSPRREPNSTWL